MPQPRTQNVTSITAKFLTCSLGAGERITLFVRRKSPRKMLQRIAPLESKLAPRYFGWLAYENSVGASSCGAANPLRTGRRKPTEECTAMVRHLHLDFDIEGEVHLTSHRASDVVPTRNVMLSTLLGKYKAPWRVDGFTFEPQGRTPELLAIAIESDPSFTDCERVLRRLGLLNYKFDPAHQYASNACAIRRRIPLTSIWTFQRRNHAFVLRSPMAKV